MKTDYATMELVFSLIEKDAAERENNAAHGGEHGDRGASRLREEIRFYREGMSGSVPSNWTVYYEKAKAMQDPEWEEYKRLKLKFKSA
jgi:hypothetical protein